MRDPDHLKSKSDKEEKEMGRSGSDPLSITQTCFKPVANRVEMSGCDTCVLPGLKPVENSDETGLRCQDLTSRVRC